MSKTENAIAIVITNERKKGYHHNVLKLNAEAGMVNSQASLKQPSIVSFPYIQFFPFYMHLVTFIN